MTKEEAYEARRRPIPAGTIVYQPGSGNAFQILEDTTAHGCPWVKYLVPGRNNAPVGYRTPVTLYLHQPGWGVEIPDPATIADLDAPPHAPSSERLRPMPSAQRPGSVARPGDDR